jgi:hypothetical protein
MIVSHLFWILHKKYSFISLCLKPEMWQKVTKFKGAEYFCKALYEHGHNYTEPFSENLSYLCVDVYDK